MRRVRWLVAAASAALWLALVPPAAAFPLTGCSLGVTSFDESGTPIGVAASGDASASPKDPLDVDWNGKVAYHGSTGSVIQDYTYHVSVFGIPTPLIGADSNNSGNTTADDSVDPGEFLPFQITGLYFVSGSIEGSGGSCSGSGWVRLLGDPLTSPLFGAAVVTALLGLMLISLSFRGRHTFRGLLGGVLAGIGVALGCVSTGFGIAEMPLAEYGPLLILLVILMIGALIGWLDIGSGAKPQADA